MISKYILKSALIVMAVMMLSICAAQNVRAESPPVFESYAFPAGQYASKVDSFLVILDASASMAGAYNGRIKLSIAKDFLNAMSQTIPDIEVNGGIRKFGMKNYFFKKRMDLIYGFTPYTRNGFSGALQSVPFAAGSSPLASAMDKGAEDFQSAAGKRLAVIIVSDGNEMDDGPARSAQEMKGRYGDRICIYTVLIGDDPEGKKLLEQVAGASQCGASFRSDDFTSSKDMADFVEKVFFTSKRFDSDGDGVYNDEDQCPRTPPGIQVDQKGCPLDTDGDGVYDYVDNCPGTPRGIRVDMVGCPLDTDGDGVYDYMDECPDTPKGVKVDAKGCSLDSDGDGVLDADDACPGTPVGAKVNAQGCWVLAGVLFDTGKWDITAAMASELDGVAAVLKRNPALKLEIQGHTDNMGEKSYNQMLSENRAKVVMDYLAKEGIKRSRLSAKGFGFSNPIAGNDTPAGRAKNRRVELNPIQ